MMKLWTEFTILIFLPTVFQTEALDLLNPFNRPLIRLPENPLAGQGSRDRDRSRYRHNFPINPLTRNADNNQTFAPVIWDLAPESYPIDYFLYTKDNPYSPELLTLNNATDSKYFDPTKQTKVIMHDFMQSTENALIQDLKDVYMSKKENFNVIMVDWEPARKYTYTVAVTVSEYVGKMTGRLILTLKANPEKIHVIGFGLGAHAAGVMGNDLRIQKNMTLARITGLDPSLPLFRMAGNYFKLDREDAQFVDVIHTDGGDNLWNSNHLGMGQELGHIDIYPNRGIFQPGCRHSSLPNYDALHCSHSRALEIFKESVLDPMSFVACRCPTWTDFTESRCNCREPHNRIFVGEATSSAAPRGSYYLVTNESPPYGMGGKGTTPDLTRGADPGIVMQSLFAPNGSLVQGIGQIAHIFTAPIKPFFNNLIRNAQPPPPPQNNNYDFMANFFENLNRNLQPPPTTPSGFQQDQFNVNGGQQGNNNNGQGQGQNSIFDFMNGFGKRRK